MDLRDQLFQVARELFFHIMLGNGPQRGELTDGLSTYSRSAYALILIVPLRRVLADERVESFPGLDQAGL
jgi:hypothetical protein